MGEGRAKGSWTVRCASDSKVRLITLSKGEFTWENSHRRKFSYRHDLLVWYRVHMIMGHFMSGLFEGILHVDKIHVRFKVANITHALPVPGGRPNSHRSGWSFRVHMMPLRDFVPEWNSRPDTTTGVNSRRDDSRRHDILWWYHVNKCRAMTGNRSELAPARKSPRCRVNTP